MGSHHPHRTSPIWLLASAALCLLAAVGCGYFYAVLYWPYRALFDPDGRYLDEATMVVYHQQTGVLLVFAVVFFALAMLAGAAWFSSRRFPGGAGSS